MDTKKDLVVRMVQRGDTHILMDFMNAISREQTYIMYQGRQFEFEAEDAYIKQFMESVEKGDAVKLLAFHGGVLVGVADVVRSAYQTEPHVGTFGIIIAHDWRGKGIGSYLMDTTLAEMQKKMTGITIVRLGVFGNNPVAERMYAKKGFVRYGVLPQGLIHRGVAVDHIFMYKQITHNPTS